MLTAVACEDNATESKNSLIIYDSTYTEAPTQLQYEEIEGFFGESSTYGDMTLTVTKAEDPGITMNDGKMVVFFEVTIDNGSQDTVTTNYLNNFSLTVDGKSFTADQCFTIPVMKKLYDFYGCEAFQEEIPAGGSFTGYLSAEVEPAFQELQLHYTPKTTDSGSRITVTLTSDMFEKVGE